MHQPLSRNLERFRGGLVCKAHRLLYHSDLGSSLEEEEAQPFAAAPPGTTDSTCIGCSVEALGFAVLGFEFWVWDSGLRVWGFKVAGLEVEGGEFRVQGSGSEGSVFRV